MINMDNLTIYLSWGERSCIDDDMETGFVYESSGDICCDLNNDDDSVIGKFRVYYLDVKRIKAEGYSILEVADAHPTWNIMSVYGPVFRTDESDSGELQVDENGQTYFEERIINPDRPDLLIIDNLELLPEYRGRGLGEKIMSHIVKRFMGGAGLVATMPYPAQLETPATTDQEEWWCSMDFKKYPGDTVVAKERLCKYFESIGFEQIANTGVMTTLGV